MDEQEALISSYLNNLISFEKAKQGIQTVDEINCSLNAYGFTNFQIVPSPSKNCYKYIPIVPEQK